MYGMTTYFIVKLGHFWEQKGGAVNTYSETEDIDGALAGEVVQIVTLLSGSYLADSVLFYICLTCCFWNLSQVASCGPAG